MALMPAASQLEQVKLGYRCTYEEQDASKSTAQAQGYLIHQSPSVAGNVKVGELTCMQIQALHSGVLPCAPQFALSIQPS